MYCVILFDVGERQGEILLSNHMGTTGLDECNWQGTELGQLSFAVGTKI